MDAICRNFWNLKLSEYQSLMHFARPKCETYMKKVFNQKRNCINASGAIQVELTFEAQRLFNEIVLNEFIHNNLLMSIDLSKNKLCDEDAKNIANGMAVSTSLTNIDLSDNFIEPKGAVHIAEGISECTSLTKVRVSVSNNPLDALIFKF